jgi:alpha-1,3-glucosyltransferase
MDRLEKVYLAGFPFLLLFVSILPYLQTQSESAVNVCISSNALVCPDPQLNSMKSSPKSSVMEFLPLMATSIYCALGLVWSFMRLGYIYLYEETSYQGQLSSIH